MHRRLATLCLAGSLTLLSAAAAQPGESGDALRSAGDFAAAGRAYEAALKAAPADPDALAGLAQIRLYENRGDEAMSLAKQALAVQPSNPTAPAVLAAAEQRKAAFAEDRYQVSGLSSEAAIPFVATDPLPIVQVSLGGRQAYFVIDTGAPDIVVNAELASELGVQVRSAGEGVFGGGRRAPIARGTMPELEIGPVKITNVPAAIRPAGAPSPNFGFKIEGTIGTGVLMHFLSTLDYCRGRLVLRPRDASSGVRRMGTGAGSVPFWLAGDHFLFSRAHLTHGSEGLFMLDTGGAGFGLMATKPVLDEAGVTTDPSAARTLLGGGGPVRAIPFRSGATLGSMTVDDVQGSYTPDGDPYAIFPFKISGTLTHGFFRHSSVSFDFDRMQLTTQACAAR